MPGKTTKVEFDIFARDHGSPVFDKFGRRIKSSGKDLDGFRISAKGVITAFAGWRVISEATQFLKHSNDEARESIKVNKLTEQLVRRRGKAERMTAKDVQELSTAVSNKIAVDDEAIQGAANMLLTFHKVRNEVGAGADIFDRATKASGDLASIDGMGGLIGSSKMLGKALQDPTKGISALARAGVQFSQSQKDQIAKLIQNNDLLGAQKVILGEVEDQVKGSARAQADGMDRARVAYDNAAEAVGTALLPYVEDLSNAFADRAGPAADKFAKWLTKEGVPAIRDFGEEAGPVAKSVLPALGSGLEMTADALKVIAPLVKKTVDAFNSLPKSAQTAILIGGAGAYLGNATLGGLGGIGVGAGGKGAGKAGASVAGGAASAAGKGGAAGPYGLLAAVGAYETYLGVKATHRSLNEGLPKFAPGNRMSSGTDRRSDATRDAQHDQFNKKQLEYAKQADAMLAENARKRAAANKTLTDSFSATNDKAGSLNQTLDMLGRKDAKPKVQAKGLTGLLTNLGDLGRNLDKVDKKNAKPKVKAAGLTGTLQGIAHLGEGLRAVDGYDAKAHVSVGGITSTLQNLASIGRKLKSLDSHAHARGTMNAPGGLSLVGEEGPELVDMPKGSKVYTASRSRQMMSDAATRAGSRGLGSSEQAPIEVELHVTFGVDQRTAAKIVQKGTPARVTLK